MARSLRIGLALVIALVVGTMVVLARDAGLLNGARGIALLAVLVVLVPVSRSLSRRLMLSGTLVLGWLPVLWWFDLFGLSDRATWFVAAGWAAFAFWIAVADTSARFRAIVPRWRWIDLIPISAGAFSTWLYAPFFVSANDVTTLNILMKSGWDHVAHFFMVSHLAVTGSLQAAAVAAPDGTSFVDPGYPRQFHILTYLANELSGHSGEYAVAGGGVHAYGEGMATVLIAMTVVLAAAIAQLPGLIRRPLLAWPVVSLVVAAFVLGPGSASVAAGFPNFVLACGLVIVCACIAVSTPRVFLPLQLAAMGGTIVAVAHTWLLLVPLAAAAVIIALIPFRRQRWSAHRRNIVVSVLIVILTGAAAFQAVLITARVLNAKTLGIGGVEDFPAGLVALVSFGVLGLAAVAFARRRPARATSALRASSASLVVGVAVVILAFIGIQQLATSGELSYYFSKFATGMALVGFGIAAVVVSSMVPRTARAIGTRARVLAVTGSTLLTLAVVQLFGYAGPTIGGQITEQAPGLRYRSDSLILSSGESGEALRLTNAARLRAESDWAPTVYLAPLPGDQLLPLANQWHLALSGDWSTGSGTYGEPLNDITVDDWTDADELAGHVKEILAADDRIQVIVSPDVRTEITGLLDPHLAGRVLTW